MKKDSKSLKSGTTTILLGNLNVGKTVIFNKICGKKSTVANYPGTSVQIGRGTFSEDGKELRLIDTPGINSLTGASEDEIVSRSILLSGEPDTIAQVADGKNLRRTLLLTLALIEYGKPLVLDINMMDEVRQRGIHIDTERLSSILGVEITRTVAIEGEGISSFREALVNPKMPEPIVRYHPIIEDAVSHIGSSIQGQAQRLPQRVPTRALAVALLSGDEGARRYVVKKCGSETLEKIEPFIRSVQSEFARPIGIVLTEARMKMAEKIIDDVQTISPPAKMPFSEKFGEWSRKPATGIPIAILVVILMYLFVGRLGADILVGIFEGKLFGKLIVPFSKSLFEYIPSKLVRDAFVGDFGLISVGLTLTFGIVLPVLATFFFAFGILEDSGYLPRLSILLNRVFRKVGMTGKGVLPMVMGFSCITMAVLTARILDTKKERFIATLLLLLGVPCAPLLGVMLVLLAKMSIWATFVVFGVIGVQILIVGIIASKILPGEPSDFILEIPPIRFPKISSLLVKTALRTKWFLKEAVPLFLLATFIMFILEKFGALMAAESAMKPVLEHFIGLPSASVKVFTMALVRRESGAALLKQMAEGGEFDNVQIVVALLIMTFFSPCINAFLVVIRERGLPAAISILCFVTPYAILVGAAVNWICRTLGLTFA